jgi:hypothetical protein
VRGKALGWVLLSAAATCFPAAQPNALTPLVRIRFSPDITVSLDTATVNAEDVGADDLAGTVTVQSIGTIPSGANLDAYNERPNGDRLLSFDTTVALPGGLIARPGDVVRYDGATYVMAFDAATHGIPNGANVDAVAVYGGSLLLSFDVAVDLNGLHVDADDLVLFDGASFSMFFDGSGAGVAPGLNLDAADYLACDDHLLLSFDGSGTSGGVAFDDDDVLEFDRVGTWEMAYNGSAQHPGWSVADLDAVHATINLGSGPPVVFGQTIQSAPTKTDVVWPSPVPFRAVRGSFASSADIGAYRINFTALGTGALVSDPSTPAAGSGYWYLVKPGGCIQSSWQSAIGSEPGRDAAIP